MTRTVLESKTQTVTIGFDEPFCVIGERINPTGRKVLAAQLEAGDFSTVEKDALEQVACGAMVLDVNAGVVYNSNPNPNETEPPLMTRMLEMIQKLVDVPLCIDSSVPGALEAGLAVAERLSSQVLCLPLHAGLKSETVEAIAARVVSLARPAARRASATK